MEGLFEGSTESVIGIEANFGGDLVDRVVGFFQELFSLLETKLQAVLIRADLKELPETLLQFELIDPRPIREDRNVDVMDGIFFDEGFCQFNGGNVVKFGALDGMSVADDSFLAHGDKV